MEKDGSRRPAEDQQRLKQDDPPAVEEEDRVRTHTKTTATTTLLLLPSQVAGLPRSKMHAPSLESGKRTLSNPPLSPSKEPSTPNHPVQEKNAEGGLW